jgi:hypothetical protein
VIDTPRQRHFDGVEVHAYSAEKLFDWRHTEKSRYFSRMPPGYIFQTLIDEENRKFNTGAVVGDIYTGGALRTIEYHYHDLLKRFQDLARLTGNDFAVTSEYLDGELTIKASWHESRGNNVSKKVKLIEGKNCSAITMSEQGQIANQIRLAGSGDNWGPSRKTSVTSDDDSLNRYGYREYAETQNTDSQETLDANATELLALKKNPQIIYTVDAAINLKPGLFSSYDIGDTITIEGNFNAGAWQPINETVRVIARQYSGDDKVRLEVK